MARLSSFGPSSPGSPPSPVRLMDKFDVRLKQDGACPPLLSKSNPVECNAAHYLTIIAPVLVGCDLINNQ